jgi:hypothetical protein
LDSKPTKTCFANGQNVGFLEWAGALIIIAAGSRIVDLPHAGKAFVVLVPLVFLLDNGDLLNSLLSQLKSVAPGAASAAPAGTTGSTQPAPLISCAVIVLYLIRTPLRWALEGLIIGFTGGIGARLSGVFSSPERAERQRER